MEEQVKDNESKDNSPAISAAPQSVNLEDYRTVLYEGQTLFFDKKYSFHEHFGHKQKTRRFPYYKNVINFLSENQDIHFYFTLDPNTRPFMKVKDGFIINMDSYLEFCRAIGGKTLGRIKAFLSQNLRIRDISISEEEKHDYIVANASEKNIIAAIKTLSPESQSSVVAALQNDIVILTDRMPSDDQISALISDDAKALDVVRKIFSSSSNVDGLYEIFKDNYPLLDRKILAYKLIEARRKALEEFSVSLSDIQKKERNYWQPFLEKNRWMFGLSYFVSLDETRIDLWDTADYLFKSEDGFIDIVEIKHPHIDFWQNTADGSLDLYRGFLQPSSELRGSITQGTNYIFQVEKKFSDPDWQQVNKCDTPVKPKCTIIFGRSNSWSIDERTAFRLLNDSLHGIEIITFDHLYDRATRLLRTLEDEA